MPEQPRSPLTWFIAALLTAQLGLLWLHGALLHRQQAQLVQLHEDIQDLADALDAQTEGDSSSDGGDGSDWAPARTRHRHARLGRAHLRLRQEPEDGKPAPDAASKDSESAGDAERKELEESRKSAKEAVAKGRDLNQKLSLQENYRKGQEAREVQEAQYAWTRWVWVALLVLAAAFGIRAYVKRNA